MPAPPDDARFFHASVEGVEACGDDAVILVLRPDRPLEPVRASRFFMLKRVDGLSPLIPRPFSLYRQAAGRLEFLIKVMGAGTRALAELKAGERIALTGPLGNGWPALDRDGPPWVMLAGGVGCAPFPLAIEQALGGYGGAPPCAPEHLRLLFGAATAGLLYDLEALGRLGVAVDVATDDGSAGRRGNVLDLLADLQGAGDLPAEVRLLACGPDPMLRAVERLARERGWSAWLSLETLMGCGVGICNGCPVDTRPEGPLGSWPNAKCCVEGPVFSVEAVTLLAE